MNSKTPLPTVEEELWKALNKARLVFPTPNPLLEPGKPNWEGCEYSKCGRTDKGVSAFGQVIGIRVRSNRPVSRVQTSTSLKDRVSSEEPTPDPNPSEVEIAAPRLDPEATTVENETSTSTSTKSSLSEEPLLFHPVDDEIPYCQILNRLLPPDIRMLAWCPTPSPHFSARFSCKERRYKYFFTQPAFTPTIGVAGLFNGANTSTSRAGRRREGWLDIEAMREAAQKFIGLHDFRNFCKVDPSKQIENFDRRIFHANIEKLDLQKNPIGYVGKPGFQQYEDPDEAPGGHLLDDFIRPQPSTPAIYAFTLQGSAFLWHQVRHMVAILFLVGQGLENPSIVDNLLDVEKNPCKPQYEMADAAPLVLWDCVFPREGSGSKEDALEWIYVGDYTGEEEGIIKAGGRKGDGKYGMGGVVDDGWKVWRKRKIDEVLAGTLLDVIVGQGNSTDEATRDGDKDSKYSRSQKVFQGGDGPRLVGKYIPVLEKPRLESVEAINAKYAQRNGFQQNDEIKKQGFRRMASDPEKDHTE